MREGEPKFNNETVEQEVSPEFIEALEKTPFSPQDQTWILLTKAGLKPASWTDFVIRNEKDGKINKNIPERSIQETIALIQNEFRSKFEREIADIKRNKDGDFVDSNQPGKKVGEEEQISFIIGSSDEDFQKLALAISTGNERDIGLALGYLPTAVDAYCGNGKVMNPADLPKEFRESDAFSFNPGALSADHWQEELAHYQKWADYVKRTSPNIYRKMMEFMQEK